MDVAVKNNPIFISIMQCDLFARVEWKIVQMLAQQARMTHYGRSEIVFQSGDDNRGLFLLRSGQLKLSIISPKGSERVINILMAGNTFGEAALFSGQVSCMNAEMLAAGEVIEIPQGSVYKAIQQSKTLATSTLHRLGSNLHRMVGEVENCCLCSAQQRVVDYLVSLIKQQAIPDDRAASISLPACKGVVASLLDLTPETFSRELNRLSGLGLIRVEKKDITIPDVDNLVAARN